MNSSTVSDNQDATAAQYNNLRKDVVQMAGDYATSSGSANAYVLAVDAQIVTAYVTGTVFKFNANFANTGAATLNVNTLGAVTIKKAHDQDLASGDIESGQLVVVMYDGTNFQLLSPIATQMTTANAAILTDGSVADSLHKHTHTSGVATALDNTGSVSINEDETITTGFLPQYIRLNYFLQGYESATGYESEEGIVTYSGTTLQSHYVFRQDTATGSDDFVPPDAVKIRDTNAPTLGDTGVNGRRVVLSILSVSATGFVIRKAITDGSGHSAAHIRAQIIWEAWQ